MQDVERMSPSEIKAVAGLASIYGLRMLGMFLILPVFGLYAAHLPGANQMLIGIALGIYGLTQALLQLPFGMASDHFGRKRVMYVGLALLAVGSFIAAVADDIHLIIVGRALQGAGAISAVITALLADLTREEHRTKAMAMIGGTIGITFSVSLVVASPLEHWIGVPGIFALTGMLAIVALAVVRFVIPDPQASRFHSDAEASPARLKDVLRDAELMRLNFGIFALHAAQMALFVVLPFALKDAGGLEPARHWLVYLPVMAGAFAVMLPALIYAERKMRLKEIFLASIALMFVTQLMLAEFIDVFWGMVLSLFSYFIAFNVLEATLPSIISKLAPASAKGTAMGVYNTCQSFGMFLGGAVGGYFAHYHGDAAVFWFCSALVAVWFLLALDMRRPPAVRTKMFHVREMDPQRAQRLGQALGRLRGVREALVVGEEGIAILKIDMHGWNEAGVLKLIEGERNHGIGQ